MKKFLTKKGSRYFDREKRISSNAEIIKVKTVIGAKKKIVYSCCAHCKSNNTYFFIAKESGNLWMCNNCNNHFYLTK